MNQRDASPGIVTGRLTSRQQRLVRALLAGSTNREIANRLGLQEQTVKNQLSVIYNTLGVRNRLELAMMMNRDPLERATDN